MTVLNVFFTRSLAGLLKDTPVIVDTVNPGFCVSEIRNNFTGMAALVNWVMDKALARSTENGARQLIYAAIGSPEDPERLHGQYLNLHRVEEPSDFVVEEAAKERQDKLWVGLSQLHCKTRAT